MTISGLANFHGQAGGWGKGSGENHKMRLAEAQPKPLPALLSSSSVILRGQEKERLEHKVSICAAQKLIKNANYHDCPSTRRSPETHAHRWRLVWDGQNVHRYHAAVTPKDYLSRSQEAVKGCLLHTVNLNHKLHKAL